MPESVLLNTGCVPDYVYATLLILAGVSALILRRRVTKLRSA